MEAGPLSKNWVVNHDAIHLGEGSNGEFPSNQAACIQIPWGNELGHKQLNKRNSSRMQ